MSIESPHCSVDVCVFSARCLLCMWASLFESAHVRIATIICVNRSSVGKNHCHVCSVPFFSALAHLSYSSHQHAVCFTTSLTQMTRLCRWRHTSPTSHAYSFISPPFSPVLVRQISCLMLHFLISKRLNVVKRRFLGAPRHASLHALTASFHQGADRKIQAPASAVMGHLNLNHHY